MIAAKNTYIKSAYKTLQVIRQDEEKRMAYEAGEKALRDYNQGMLEAELRGREIDRKEGQEIGQKEGQATGEYEKAIQIAKNMFAIGLSEDMVTQVTGLSSIQIELLLQK